VQLPIDDRTSFFKPVKGFCVVVLIQKEIEKTLDAIVTQERMHNVLFLLVH